MIPRISEPFRRFDLSHEPTVIDQKVLASEAEFEVLDEGKSFVLTRLNQTVEIRKRPFAIFVSDAKGPRIAVNAGDTAIFETHRNSTAHREMFQSTEFDGYKDQIRNGPTSVAIDFEFNASDVRFMGLPAHTYPLVLPQTIGDEPIRFFNTDLNRFEIGNGMAMYGGVPFVFARSSTGCDGVFWCNPSETWVDIGPAKTRFISEGGYIDFFVFSGTPSSVVGNFTAVTGRPQLVPLFALGFHQSRWGYKTADEVKSVSSRLDALSVPHDVLWLDLDHTDDRRYFKFHPMNFRQPEHFLYGFESLRRKVVALVDPHLKVDPSYDAYTEALSRNLFIKMADGTSVFEGNAWPGQSAWPDFLNPHARAWWETRFETSKFIGSRSNLHFWNDMNEISVFDSPELTAPRDLRHFGGFEEREVHNLYGHLMASATFGGMYRRDKYRPFVLTRSFFAGTQRYAAVWTGDNAADWSHLRNSIPAVLSFGLAGMVYSGADVGGFFDSPGPELLSRWYQVGAWLYPFFRCHCHHESLPREIYNLQGDAREVARESIADRYRLLNYWYTLAREANLTGVPLVRPLWWEFPDDRFAEVDDKAMLGSALLIAPFLDEGNASLTVDLPEGRWYRWGTLAEVAGKVVVQYRGGRTPVFLRGGRIVPLRRRVRRSSVLMFADPVTLVVGLDAAGKAEGEIYVDDGDTFTFSRRTFVHRRFTFDGAQLRGEALTRGEVQQYDVVIEQVQIAGLARPPTTVVNRRGEALRFEWEDGILTIHRPQIPVLENFRIRFTF
jgi:alpha 1,3-glucosidase